MVLWVLLYWPLIIYAFSFLLLNLFSLVKSFRFGLKNGSIYQYFKERLAYLVLSNFFLAILSLPVYYFMVNYLCGYPKVCPSIEVVNDLINSPTPAILSYVLTIVCFGLLGFVSFSFGALIGYRKKRSF